MRFFFLQKSQHHFLTSPHTCRASYPSAQVQLQSADAKRLSQGRRGSPRKNDRSSHNFHLKMVHNGLPYIMPHLIPVSRFQPRNISHMKSKCACGAITPMYLVLRLRTSSTIQRLIYSTAKNGRNIKVCNNDHKNRIYINSYRLQSALFGNPVTFAQVL